MLSSQSAMHMRCCPSMRKLSQTFSLHMWVLYVTLYLHSTWDHATVASLACRRHHVGWDGAGAPILHMPPPAHGQA